MQAVTVQTHGAAKTDPGAAAVAVRVIDGSGAVRAESTETIGNATSEFAAFVAVAQGLELAQREYGTDTKDLTFMVALSHEAVKQQLNAEAPITNPGIVPLFIEIHNLRVTHFPQLTFEHVPSTQNPEVAAMVEHALDAA